MNIAIAGTGYVGLVTAVCLAETGHHVVCVDVDFSKVAMMRQGKSPIYEPDLEDLMSKNKDRLTYTTDYCSAYRHADVIFIGVGTPEKKDGSANLTYVYDVVRQIADSVIKDCVVVIKSTVPIGTNDKIEQLLQNSLKNPVRISVVSNPEFLSQGTAVHDTLHASRIVIGVEDTFSEQIMRQVYAGFTETPLLITNRKSAEMIKYASNDFLALKISYINEIANLCEIVGANVEDVATGMGYDPRIGNRFLHAGIGYGGSCFPKDTKALSWVASYNDVELKTVKAAIEVNEQQKLKLLKKARKYYNDFSDLTVAVLGLTFKPGTDDLREAPSLVNIPILLDDGAKVRAWDPVGTENFKAKIHDDVMYCDSIAEALRNADLCLIFTEWPQVKALTSTDFLTMKNPIILDGRNCLNTEGFKEANIIYEGIGK